MKVTITSYQMLAEDGNGNPMPIGEGRVQSQLLTAAGDATALAASTHFIRVATDTAIHIRPNATGAATSDELMPANTVEFFAADSGQVPSIITA